MFLQLFINWPSFLLLQDWDFLPLNSIHRLLPLIDLWKYSSAHLDPELFKQYQTVSATVIGNKCIYVHICTINHFMHWYTYERDDTDTLNFPL